eukprot:scaffold121735_cov20-Prasinocladus_malaysianus.AAC.1
MYVYLHFEGSHKLVREEPRAPKHDRGLLSYLHSPSHHRKPWKCIHHSIVLIELMSPRAMIKRL